MLGIDYSPLQRALEKHPEGAAGFGKVVTKKKGKRERGREKFAKNSST